MNRLANALCIALYALLAVSLVRIDWQGIAPLAVVPLILVGIFIADLFSGVLHVYLDYLPLNARVGLDKLYFTPRGAEDFAALKHDVFARCSPVDKISYNFKIHHLKPRYMNRKSYALQVLDTTPPAFVLALASLCLPATASLAAVVVSFFIANTQFIHACIHDTDKSVFWKGVVRTLQRVGVIYSLETHMIHHRDGRENFCLITGWANFVLNPICRVLMRADVIKSEYWATLKLDPASRRERPRDAA